MSTSGAVAASRPAPRSFAAPGRSARRGVLLGLAVAVASAAGVWLVWRIFVASAAGQRVDQAAFDGALYGRTRLWQVAQPVLDVVSVPFVALVLVVAVLIAVVRRRWGLALQVAVLMGGANLTTQLLKNFVFDRPEFASGYLNTLPSGHTTVAASVAAAFVFVVPPRARPSAAVLGAAYTAVTGVSTLIGRWHRPSDVVAAVLVVLAWSGLACALAAASGPRQPDGAAATVTAEFARPLVPSGAGAARRRRPNALGVGGILLLVAALLAALPAAYSLHRLWTTSGDLETRAELLVAYAGGAFGVVAVTAAAFAALLVARHGAGRPS
ncbi:phosphatase PAP2 family protein [Pengzhenrongella sicca]|uniref:Phosphatase PAP2 family protein n=1 Tax=Pengzhenrongella sicca TaxID=2819238 RepID=A0A8A4ZGR8_9MICO|nr:phosphatase PAP2 family protein [Pengzhenrongella sicca]QTE29726.1 phosphatase PAP2 family protein [Pengzhenrongella sicca]